MKTGSSGRQWLRPIIEELEQRLLMSADVAAVLVDPNEALEQRVEDPAAQLDLLQAEAEAGEVAVIVRSELVFVDTDVEGYERLVDDLVAGAGEGRTLEVVEIPQPAHGEAEDGRRLCKSYVNLYIANGGVVMPAFEDAADKAAFEIVAKCFPEHRLRQIAALDILRGGGGIHCITQQQPAGPAAAP